MSNRKLVCTVNLPYKCIDRSVLTCQPSAPPLPQGRCVSGGKDAELRSDLQEGSGVILSSLVVGATLFSFSCHFTGSKQES